MNITEPLRRAARLTPDAVAIIRADASEISYGMLDRAIDRMALRAQDLGLSAGDIAGLSITGPDESLGLILALALARIGVAVADPSLPAQYLRLSFQAARAGKPLPAGKIRFDASWIPSKAQSPDEPVAEIHAGGATLCIVCPSSGTTGVPKQVPISHDLMKRRVIDRWLGFGGDAPAIRIVAISLSGTWGFASVLRTLWQGGTLVLSNPKDAAPSIQRHRVTSITASPVALRTILDALPPGSGPFASLQTIEVGGSVFPEPLRHQVATRLCAGIVSYLGSSELGGIASAPSSALLSRPGAVGYLWPGVEVQAVDSEFRPLPPGVGGILRIRGDAMATSYFDNVQETKERFRDGWFISSDIGAVWPDGLLTLTGRASELINAGGVKVSPHVIEDAFLSLPTVTDAAAFGVPDASGVDQIWTAIVARARIDDVVLKAFCQRMLRELAPGVILQMKALPRNAAGKIMRQELVEIAVKMNLDQPNSVMARHQQTTR